MKYTKLLLFLIFAGVIGCIDARRRSDVKKVKSEKSFDKYMRHGLVAVLFYEQGKKPSRRHATDEERDAWEALEDKNDDLLAMFEAAADRYLYEEGDLLFVSVDVARYPQLKQTINYTVNTFPTVMLFNFGAAIRDSLGSPVKLSGYMTQTELYNFIDSNIGEKLEERKKEKAEYRKKKLEEAKIRSYYAPYFYWGGPYYGYGYPYYWGWGYPYGGWRGYWW